MKPVFLVAFVFLTILVMLGPATGDRDREGGNKPESKPERMPHEPGKRNDGKPRKSGKGPGAMPKEKGVKFDGEFGKPEDDPNDFKYGDTLCRVLGKSGAIAISKLSCTPAQPQNETGDGSNDEGDHCTQKKAIIIRIESLEEKNKDGMNVGQGSGGHVFKNFAQQDFHFDADYDGTVPNSNVTALIVTYSAFLTSVSANFTVTIYIIKENGSVKNDNETQYLKKGSVKFSIDIAGWDFLDVDGKYLDLELDIKSPGKPTKTTKGRGGRTYTMDDSGSSEMTLSEKVKADDYWVDMEDDFPKMEQRGTHNIFKFRFPKHSARLFYDPEISPSDEIKHDDKDGAPRTPLSLALLGSILMAAWALL